MPQVKLRKST